MDALGLLAVVAVGSLFAARLRHDEARTMKPKGPACPGGLLAFGDRSAPGINDPRRMGAGATKLLWRCPRKLA